MIDKRQVKEQLIAVGADCRFWGRAEANELPQLLFDDEVIKCALNGRYEKGFALLVATNHRLLLLDKKPFVLCFEDMRYEMVSEVDYTEKLFAATISLRTPGRVLQFMSYRIRRLRELTSFIQDRVTHTRSIIHDIPWEYDSPTQRTPDQNFYQMVKPINTSMSEPVNSHSVTPEQLYMGQHSQQLKITQPNHQPMAYRARRRIPKFSPLAPTQASKT